MVLLALSACVTEAPPPPPSEPPAEVRAGPLMAPMVLAHGGAGSPPSRSDGCRAAVDAALAALEAGADAMDAAIAGVRVMEDDPRFNAGTGSVVRLDGLSVQMDAGVMHSDGRFGAVMVVEDVQHPIDVARAVVDTPHLMLAGDGATRFARTLGMPPYDPATDKRREKARKNRIKLNAKDPSLPEAWKTFGWRERWNFEEDGFTEDDLGGDTVGVVVRDGKGDFGVALSTGGTSVTLYGRVGDTPILGAGLYAGPHAAIAATGTGERVVEATLSRRVHDWLEDGTSPAEAADRAVAELKDKGSIGIIIVGRTHIGVAAKKDMAWAARSMNETTWQGPNP